MLLKILLLIGGVHIVGGVFLPALLIMHASRRRIFTQKLRHIVNAWMFTAWGLFFLCNSITMITYYPQVEVTGKIVLGVGASFLGLLTLFFLWQAKIQWNFRKKG